MLLVGACSSSGGSAATTSSSSAATSPVDKASFCDINRAIEAAVASSSSAEQFLADLKSVEPKFDQLLATAPPEVKADAQVLVDGARAAFAKNDGSAFITNATQQSGQSVDKYCGVNTGTTAPTN
ncbi:MAG: hypothetical protein QOE63_1504 [Acidimicrobiaceae bacterium]